MADLQTDGARVVALWRNEGISSYRKRPRDPGQLAKLVIDIDSGEDRETPKSAKPLSEFAQSLLPLRNRGGGPLSEAGDLLVRNKATPHGAN
jgi:hypothetical protein